MTHKCDPLKPEDCETINKVLASCHTTDEMIQKCKAAGLPVEEYEAQNNQQKQIMSGLKAQFFPHNA
jgi:hypothetical protein